MAFTRFVGIDISKTTIDVAVFKTAEKENITHSKFKNTKSDFIKMIAWIEKAAVDSMQTTVFFLEHTGLYSLPLCLFFEDAKLNYCLESPLQISRSLGIKRGKTDKADAIMLAKYAYMHREELQLNRVPHKAISKLRSLLALRDRFVKAKILLAVPAKEQQSFQEKDISKIICKHSDAVIKTLLSKIKATEDEIQKLIKSEEFLLKTYNLVQSVPCIGPITGAYLLVYTKCFKAFDNSKKFACYAGLAPFEHMSGTSIRGKTQVSYIANRHIKSLLTTCAVLAAKHDKELNAYFIRKVEGGKTKMSVINAIRNKLVSRVFATVKRGTPFVKTIAFEMA